MCYPPRSTLFSTFLFIYFFITPPAHATLVTFENLPDNLSLSNEIPGALFSRATILTAGISLNEFDFPPKSGDNVAAALGGLMEITFSSLIDMVSGYFSYSDPLTLSIYNANGNLLTSIQSAGTSNLGGNELISLSSQGIAMLRINSDNHFTLDDLSYNTTSIPEPATTFLFVIGAMMIGAMRSARTHTRSL